MARTIDLEVKLKALIAESLAHLAAEVAEAVRQKLAADLRTHLLGQDSVRTPSLAAAAPKLARPRRILPCIATGCRNPSKGPRFHYLCDQHRSASKSQIDAWRKARRGDG